MADLHREISHLAWLLIECPTCAAKPREHCVTDPAMAGFVHMARHEAAAENTELDIAYMRL